MITNAGKQYLAMTIIISYRYKLTPAIDDSHVMKISIELTGVRIVGAMAFKMILKDPDVKVILINIFGGITRCDDIAKGILASLEELDVPVPIIVRLVGTNEEEGRKLLVGTKLESAETLESGATMASELGGQG